MTGSTLQIDLIFYQIFEYSRLCRLFIGFCLTNTDILRIKKSIVLNWKWNCNAIVIDYVEQPGDPLLPLPWYQVSAYSITYSSEGEQEFYAVNDLSIQ